MEKYTLTYEGRAILRRMESRVSTDSSYETDDLKILEFLYENGAASVDDIESYTELPRGELVNKLLGIMKRGYIEALARH